MLPCSLRLPRHPTGDGLYSSDAKHRNLALQGNCTLALSCPPPWCEISQNTPFGIDSCRYSSKVDNGHPGHLIPHDLRWSCSIFLFTIFSMPQGHRWCSEGSYWLSQGIWRILSQNTGQYMMLKLENAKWHLVLISWIGHQGDHLVWNKQWEGQGTM